MGNKKELTLTGGVVIDGLNVKKDLFYYRIPPSLSGKVRVGAKVSVPFGPKNIKVSAFLFTIRKSTPSDTNLKEIISVMSPPLFDEQIRDLILFTAEKFFIPLHIFVNKTVKGISPEIYKRFVICSDEEGLQSAVENFSGKKKKIVEFVLERKVVPISVLKKRFGSYYGKVLKILEDEGFVDRVSLSEKFAKPYISLNIPYEEMENAIDLFEDKKLRSSAAMVLARLCKANSPLRKDILKKGIKQGKKVIDFLLEKGILKAENIKEKDETKINAETKLSLVCGLPFSERAEKIISLISEEGNGRVLILFPELSVLQKAKGEFEKKFGDKVFVWNGRNKQKLIEAIYFKNTKVFLGTPSFLFVRIPNLKYLILEKASSRYFSRSDFVPFDTLVVSLKKAKLEKLHLIFSSFAPEENIFYLIKNKILRDSDCNFPKIPSGFNVKIVDMREEFKKHNYTMLSSPLRRETAKALRKSENVALLLNRKSYSTFVMCRECGYVMRCPNCKVPLYYDKGKNLLYCHICGHTERPPDICPRCGSVNIKYFSGGLQKLEEQLSKTFPNTKIVKLVSEGKTEGLIKSKEFEKTIFIGTEFLANHLELSGISVFGFVSADIFLNKFSFDASVETFSVISNVAAEMRGRPVYVQTYIPEHFALRYVRNFLFKEFFEEELEMRKILRYPPFENLIVFMFSSKERNTALNNAEEFKDKILSVLRSGEEIYGPSPSAIEKKGDFYFYEISVKTESIDKSLRDIYIEHLNSTKGGKISAVSYVSVKEGLL